MKRGLIFLLTLLLLFPAALSAASGEENTLTVTLPETVKGFSDNPVRVEAPFAGVAEVRILDVRGYCWRVFSQDLAEDGNKFSWDGLGEFRERLLRGKYRVEVVLAAPDGQQASGYAVTTVNAGTKPTLQYFLPSSDTLYTDGSEEWYAECWLSGTATVVMEVLKDNKVVYTKTAYGQPDEAFIISWNGKGKNRKPLAPGDYTLHAYSKKNPAYDFTWDLRITDQPSDLPPVDVTGPIMPERGLSDEELWEVMMRPSVVTTPSSYFGRVSLYEEPSLNSKKFGALRGQCQAVEVLEIKDNWALVRASDHPSAKEITGYLPLSLLMTARPSSRYAVLIDKRDQTMTVFESGRRLATFPVSTGRPEEEEKGSETPAGMFLTRRHEMSSFASGGFRYEYPIRYDGANLIHGTGYLKVSSARDYEAHLAQLGQKASDGCVRVSSFVSEQQPINIYWLWTHLPVQTRVVVWDD